MNVRSLPVCWVGWPSKYTFASSATTTMIVAIDVSSSDLDGLGSTGAGLADALTAGGGFFWATLGSGSAGGGFFWPLDEGNFTVALSGLLGSADGSTFSPLFDTTSLAAICFPPDLPGS